MALLLPRHPLQVFMGIPYGGSVNGDNRWRDALPPKPWHHQYIFNATTRYPPACPQVCPLGPDSCPPKEAPRSEDCLILNVFTPRTVNENTKLPVLVFIPGGAFLFGYSASDRYDGSYLASHHNIIVVTINYHLGALGFLVYNKCDRDPIRGNFGIKDQILALKWVRDNIHNFGGDKNKVTLAGESAGAMSVAIHMTSDESKSLFHQAIIESDPFASEYSTVEDRSYTSEDFASYVDCYGLFKPSCEIQECMREKDVNTIIKAQEGLKYHIFHPWHLLAWAPSIDGKLLKGQPLDLFAKGKSIAVPTIMGTTSHEGIPFISAAVKRTCKGENLPLCYYIVLVNLFRWDSLDIMDLYPCPNGTDDLLLLLSEVFTDNTFYCPTNLYLLMLTLNVSLLCIRTSLITLLLLQNFRKILYHLHSCAKNMPAMELSWHTSSTHLKSIIHKRRKHLLILPPDTGVTLSTLVIQTMIHPVHQNLLWEHVLAKRISAWTQNHWNGLDSVLLKWSL